MTKERMQVVYSEDGLLHNPSMEITGGVVKPYLESPERLSSIESFLRRQYDQFEVVSPDDYSLGPILDVHEKDYVNFLTTIYGEWVQAGLPKEACLGDTFARPSFIGQLSHELIKKNALQTPSGKLGYYLSDMSINFVKDTWRATYSSVQVVLSAAHRLLLSNTSVYALCRPPGHHASTESAAGYCFINNAAVVTRFLQNYTLDDMNRSRQPFDFNQPKPITQGTNSLKPKILILDIDYHHGNGTQSIFYHDPTVLYISLHGSPSYPFFTGSREESGTGPGVGYNINIPLDPSTTTDESYLAALEQVLERSEVVAFDPAFVVVSLGLDTWCEDPVGGIQHLQNPATYNTMGKIIKTSLATRQKPVLFVQEGGYTIEKLGDLACRVLQGFLDH